MAPYEILPIAQENKYLGKFSYFVITEAILMSTLNIQLLCRKFKKKKKKIPKLLLLASWPGTMINPQWLKLPISRAIFYAPKDVWDIEVWLILQYQAML